MSPRSIIATITVAMLALLGLGGAVSAAQAATANPCRTSVDQPILAGDGDCWSVADIDPLVASGDWHLFSEDYDNQPKKGYVYTYEDEFQTKVLYYSALPDARGSDVISYVISDGNQLVRRSFTVSIEAVKLIMPKVTRQLTANHKAVIKFPNQGTRTVEVMAGSFRASMPDVDKLVDADSTLKMKTKRKSVDFIIYVINDAGYSVYRESGKINTRTGKVTLADDFGMDRAASRGSSMRSSARTKQPWSAR